LSSSRSAGLVRVVVTEVVVTCDSCHWPTRAIEHLLVRSRRGHPLRPSRNGHLTEDWRIDYNLNRPPQRARLAHTPVEFVEAWLKDQDLQLA
jgi:hypothetical protein